ncbi:hypothetical protein FJZ28_03870 [Candidatus Peregrinibacteria bacterium]|nr:hypothetical protein [Candidatus Peregrinibacteria bacterium]
MSRYRLLLVLWLLTDLAVFLKSYAIAYFLRVGFIFSTDFPFDHFMIAVAVASPVWLAVLLTTRTFALFRKQTEMRNAAYIGYSALVGVAMFTLIYYFLFEQFFSRLLLLTALGISFGAVWLWHIVFSVILRSLLRRTPAVFPTLIIGVTRESTALIERLQKHRSPLTPVAVLDGHGAKEREIGGVPVRGKLNKLDDVLKEGITHVIQCSDLEQSLNLLSACRSRGITYMLLPSVLGIVERDERVESVEGQPVTVVSPQESRWKWFFR